MAGHEGWPWIPDSCNRRTAFLYRCSCLLYCLEETWTVSHLRVPSHAHGSWSLCRHRDSLSSMRDRFVKCRRYPEARRLPTESPRCSTGAMMRERLACDAQALKCLWHDRRPNGQDRALHRGYGWPPWLARWPLETHEPKGEIQPWQQR